MQHAFDKIQPLIAADSLTAYQNHNKPFDIYPDASDFQVARMKASGLLLLQVIKVAAKQTVMEKEKLSIMLPSKNFRVCSLVQIFTFLLIIKT
ncbi:hypothetical protein ACHAW6_000120 [Cyclotella cf. meneghiniana]